MNERERGKQFQITIIIITIKLQPRQEFNLKINLFCTTHLFCSLFANFFMRVCFFLCRVFFLFQLHLALRDPVRIYLGLEYRLFFTFSVCLLFCVFRFAWFQRIFSFVFSMVRYFATHLLTYSADIFQVDIYSRFISSPLLCAHSIQDDKMSESMSRIKIHTNTTDENNSKSNIKTHKELEKKSKLHKEKAKKKKRKNGDDNNNTRMHIHTSDSSQICHLPLMYACINREVARQWVSVCVCLCSPMCTTMCSKCKRKHAR